MTRSMAARAVQARRSGGRNQDGLLRMALRSERFAPGVMLPGGTVATVMRFPDGSFAQAQPGPERPGEEPAAATLTRPEEIAVAAEALEGPDAVETAGWLGKLSGDGQVRVSRFLCSKCRAYRPPISRGEDGEARLGPCPNRCWG